MIRVNDKFEVEWREGMTVTALLEACRFTSPCLIVIVNGMVVEPTAYDQCPIHEGDTVKVLHMIGGG